MFEKEFWFVTFDLEWGYHHIDIDPQFWQLLGFFHSLSIFTKRQIQSPKAASRSLAPRIATVHSFIFYKNILFKNIEAEIGQIFRKFLE